MQKEEKIPFVFFGTPDYAVIVLDELKKNGFKPSLIVTAPDAPKGRGLILTPPPVKVWANENNIPILQPEKLDSDFLNNLKNGKNIKLGIVVAYGKIIPKSVVENFSLGILNVHPSLLPSFRGSSPIESAILEGVKETGVSIMLLDEKMDHGPIYAKEKYEIDEHTKTSGLGPRLFELGGKTLARILPDIIGGKINPEQQNHELATFTKKISKADGLIDLESDPHANYRKYCAYDKFPSVFFFVNKQGKELRIKIKEAALIDGNFIIKTVVPEGKNSMSYSDFENGFNNI